MENLKVKNEIRLERNEVDSFMLEYKKRMLDGSALELTPIIIDDIIREFLEFAQQSNRVPRA